MFHDTSPQRIMKCDADILEEPCTFVVLSSFGERVPNELTVSALYTMQMEEIFVHKSESARYGYGLEE